MISSSLSKPGKEEKLKRFDIASAYMSIATAKAAGVPAQSRMACFAPGGSR